MESLPRLLESVRACRICEDILEPRPVVVASRSARVMIVGQAPGSRVHASGVPFDDPSGDRLRDWMRVDRDLFYDAAKIAFLPMGFCFPGTGKGGDLAPPPVCAKTWHDRLYAQLGKIELTVVIGAYAQARWFPETAGAGVTEVVRNWRSYGTEVVPLPHPSPRNNRWLRTNPWFEAEVVPVLRRRVKRALRADA
jgi:uracil-DNA glycosylase